MALLASSSTRAPPLFLPASIMLLLSLLLLASSHHAAANTVVCNPNSYGDGDHAFADSLEDLLEELVFLTPWTPSHDVRTNRPFQGPTLVYGHAACRPGFVGEDCKFCLGYVATQMQHVCGHSLGGRAAQGDDCRVRYEQYAFTDD
ncbi:unnamed protein product [Urochloa humidicola]